MKIRKQKKKNEFYLGSVLNALVHLRNAVLLIDDSTVLVLARIKLRLLHDISAVMAVVAALEHAELSLCKENKE